MSATQERNAANDEQEQAAAVLEPNKDGQGEQLDQGQREDKAAVSQWIADGGK